MAITTSAILMRKRYRARQKKNTKTIKLRCVKTDFNVVRRFRRVPLEQWHILVHNHAKLMPNPTDYANDDDDGDADGDADATADADDDGNDGADGDDDGPRQ